MSDSIQEQFGHKYGRLPNDPEVPRLRLLMRPEAVLPQVPEAYDNATSIRDSLDILGNDRYGDCVAVTWANDRYLVTADLTDRSYYPSLDQVLDLYRTQNPGFPNEDNGMVIQYCLDYLRHSGGPGETWTDENGQVHPMQAVAFAEIDVRDPEQLRAAIAVFGAVWLGITVTDVNEDQFPSSDWTPDGRNLGGHCVPAVGYDPDTISFLTWGVETRFTEAYRQQKVDEGWVVIWPELLRNRFFLEGVDLQRLADDYHTLTGDTLDIPDNPPAPEPVDPGAAPFLRATPENAEKLVQVATHKFRRLSQDEAVARYQNEHWDHYFFGRKHR